MTSSIDRDLKNFQRMLESAGKRGEANAHRFSRIGTDGGTAYSYGPHYVLGLMVQGLDGRTMILINADESSRTTNAHRYDARRLATDYAPTTFAPQLTELAEHSEQLKYGVRLTERGVDLLSNALERTYEGTFQASRLKRTILAWDIAFYPAYLIHAGVDVFKNLGVRKGVWTHAYEALSLLRTGDVTTDHVDDFKALPEAARAIASAHCTKFYARQAYDEVKGHVYEGRMLETFGGPDKVRGRTNGTYEVSGSLDKAEQLISRIETLKRTFHLEDVKVPDLKELHKQATIALCRDSLNGRIVED